MSLVRRTEEFFAPGGRLATRWPAYEARASQRELAADVARVFENGGVLLAEAPTGIGKSLAYLLPAVLTAIETERRVVVATATKSLQDQLFERDLPVLLETLGVRVPCARLKGKQNYLCPRALEDADASAPEERATLEEVRAWAAEDPAGDLDRFPASDAEAFRRLCGRVAADADGCRMATCGRARECFWVRARRRAGEAKLVIVNHALLALGGDADGPLPPFDLLVVDEAHRLEGVLLGQLERGASRHRFEEALRLIGAGRRRGGAPAGAGGLAARMSGLMLPLFDDVRREEIAAEVSAMVARVGQARDDVEGFFAAVEPRGKRTGLYGVRERFRSAADLLGGDLDPLETLLSHCTHFARMLARWSYHAADPVGERMRSADDLANDLERAAGLWSALGADLEHLTEASRRDWVYWRTAASSGAESERAARGVELHGCPVTVGDVARRLLKDRSTAAVLTSATLSAASDFAFSAARLGLGEKIGRAHV